VIHTNHQFFRHLKNQGKMNRRHVKLVEFIKIFSYVIKYKQDTKNIIANVLSQMHVILNTLNTRLLGFDYVKELYILMILISMIFISNVSLQQLMDFYLKIKYYLCLIV